MLIISNHINKHLDINNRDASIFVSKEIMYQCVEECLKEPDTVTKCGQRYKVTKSFNMPIGLPNKHEIKVVFKRTKRVTFVITAYPI